MTSAAVAPAVLIVDDDTDIRELLSAFLHGEGYRVSSARNGREAIDQLRTGNNACVILLDLMMPVMNGWQFRTEQMRDPALASIPVIVISAVTPDTAPPIAVEQYLKKPLDLDLLLDSVRRHCQH